LGRIYYNYLIITWIINQRIYILIKKSTEYRGFMEKCAICEKELKENEDEEE